MNKEVLDLIESKIITPHIRRVKKVTKLIQCTSVLVHELLLKDRKEYEQARREYEEFTTLHEV